MRFCIIGWYGTETIGDRAILDGIFQVLGNIFGNIEIELGSLYPLLTKRTLLLDNEIFNNNSYKVGINIFDSRCYKELKGKIKNSDYCFMGGGPIMDLEELKVIDFAFKYAKKYDKKTFLFGCGLGPLRKEKNMNIVNSIFNNSDLIIFRDSAAVKISYQLYGDRFADKMHTIADPAILSVGRFLRLQSKNFSREKKLAINFRDFTNSGVEEKYKLTSNSLDVLLNKATSLYDGIILVPMHTFFIGGDDRKILTEIAFRVNKNNIFVQQKPLSIYDTFSIFYNASACIGMRYHSIVFQALLSGNNYILDYTNNKTGKIISFINDIDKDGFYKNRYFSLCNSEEEMKIDNILEILQSNKCFEYSQKIYENILNSYRDLFLDRVGTL